MSDERLKRIRKELQSAQPKHSRFIDKQMDVGAQIARYLRKKGMTQQQLAKCASLHECQVSEFLAGEGNPTLRTLAHIEEGLDEKVVVVSDFAENM